MARVDAILRHVLSGTADANVAFSDLLKLFFWKEGVEEILNLQPRGSKAKPYQVKQVRSVILKYKLGSMLDAKD